MKPTDRQIKAFWGWCGFTAYYTMTSVYDGDRFRKQRLNHFRSPEGKVWYNCTPDINLNNLFKYAPEYQQIIFQPGYCGLTKDNVLHEGSGDTEAEALFWAWDKVRK